MDLLGQFQSIHAFHPEVRDQNVEVILAEFFQRLIGVIGGDGTITLHLQYLAAQACQHLMVVDKEDGFHNASRSCFVGYGRTRAVTCPSWLPSTLFLESA